MMSPRPLLPPQKKARQTIARLGRDSCHSSRSSPRRRRTARRLRGPDAAAAYRKMLAGGFEPLDAGK